MTFFLSKSVGRDYASGSRQLLMYVCDVILNPLCKITMSDLPLDHTATKTIAVRGDFEKSKLFGIRDQIKSFSRSFVLSVEVFTNDNIALVHKHHVMEISFPVAPSKSSTANFPACSIFPRD